MASTQGSDSDGRFLRGQAGRTQSTASPEAPGIVRFRNRLAPQPAWESGELKLDALPERYESRARDGEQAAYLRCREAPGVRVYLDPRFAFSEAEARKLGDRVILLDGAGQFAPTIDSKAHFYNLDHHQECLRAFTLATCEQALVAVLKGLELDKGEWSVYANEPDLDTLFALWVLLNYRRVVAMGPERRDLIAPLLRLEGAIDANGFEVAEFCGLTQAEIAPARATLDRLHGLELELKKSGNWAKGDLGGYVVEMLGEIDQLVYERADFENFASVEEEYGHVEIGGGRTAVICRDGAGIFDVEKRLKTVWGDRLGIIALEKEPGHYTVRRSASLADIDLGAAYAKLNLLDPAVDGRPPAKRWGGSDEIGGSPRPTGTRLSPREIGTALWQAYRTRGAVSKLKQAGLAVLLTAGIAALAGLVIIVWRLAGGEAESLSQACSRLAAAALATVALTVLVSVQFSDQKRLWLFGWRRPAGKDWLLLVPLALAGATACGAWTVASQAEAGISSAGLGSWAMLGATLALWAVAVELGFRSLAHGLLVLDFPVQRVAGKWFVSIPVLVSAASYALAMAAAVGAGLLHFALPLEGALPTLGAVVAGGAVAGLALGMIRERSLSVWPGVVVQWMGWLAALGLANWLG